jgi:phage terminase large subunit
MRRLKSLEKIVKEEVLKKRPNNVIFDFKHYEYSNNVKLSSPPNPFLKIRNPLILICILRFVAQNSKGDESIQGKNRNENETDGEKMAVTTNQVF